MSRRRRHVLLWPLLALALLPPLEGARSAIAAPVGQADPRRKGNDEPVLVLAAASLGEALPAAAALWVEAGGAPVRFSFAATSRLAPLTLERGPDLFIAADREWMDWVVERGGAREEAVVPLLGNEMGVVVPAGSPNPPRGAADLARVDRLALAGENVPAGRYARAALEAAGVWAAVEPHVVRGESVRGTLEWVARGEAGAGVVYRTDAAVHPGVELAFTFPGDVAPPIVYPAAVLEGAVHPEAAAAFLAFLRGPAASAVFRDAGFEAPGRPPPLPGPQVGTLPEPGSAIALSLGVALVATLLGLVPAVLLGRLLASHEFLGKTLVTTLVLVPLVLPPVVTGFLLLALLGRRGPVGAPLGALGITVPFTFLAPVLAALVVGLPLYVLSARGAFEAVDARLEEVSWTLGVRPRPTFARVVLPLALPGIAAGAILAFARALGEFGATIVLAGNVEGRTRTIPLAVYSLLEAPGGAGAAWALAAASVLLSLLALGGYELLSRRQRRRIEERGP